MSDPRGIDPRMLDKPKRKQHRRAISVSRAAYDRLKAYCEAHDYSMSSVVQGLVNEAMDKAKQ